jgi:hypothetical protein
MPRYRADGHAPFLGTVVGLLLIVAIGLILGVVAYAISTLFYLVIFSPLLHALIAALFVVGIIRLFRIRNAGVALLLGLVMAVVTYGTFKATGYLWEIAALTLEENDQPFENFPAFIDDFRDNQRFIDRALDRGYDQPGVIGYLLFEADTGYTIEYRTTRLDITDPNMIYGIWAVEALIMLGMCVSFARRKAKQPFNLQTRRWIGKHDYEIVGSVSNRIDFERAMDAGDVARVSAHILPYDAVSQYRVVAARLGRQPAASIDDYVVVLQIRNKNIWQDAHAYQVSGAQMTALRSPRAVAPMQPASALPYSF